MRRLRTGMGGWLVAAFLATACGGGDNPGFEDVRMVVDFETAVRAVSTAQTPSVYRVKLIRATLKDSGSGQAFNVLSADSVDDSPVFEFIAGQSGPLSLKQPGQVIPKANYDVLELGIIWLEMELPFRIQNTETDRTLRIWLTRWLDSQPGDVRETSSLEIVDNWVFGPGNLTNDPELTGLPRQQAYDLAEWPDGRSAQNSGPFGNRQLWDAHTENPFAWTIDLPQDLGKDLLVTMRVAETWHFTDQDEDGEYDWPADYGNDWNMDFPDIEAGP